ncbi:MAG: SDR family NAD(P)-dependent oxidoreductase [Thermoprotei archaeon]
MNNVVIVTGASSGIGLAASKLLVKNGFSVVLASRNVEKLKSLFSGENVLIVKTDVTKISDIKNLVSETISKFSKIDVLVNNAGIGISGPLYEMNDGEIEKVIATNLFGPIMLTKEVLPIMIRNNGGCIVNVSSLAAFVPVPWMSIYAATKAALKVLTDSWRIEFKPYNIRVIGVYPGYVKTSFSANTIRTPTAQKLINVDKTIGPVLQPETIARKIVDSIMRGANNDLYIGLPYRVAHEIAVHMPSLVRWYSERLYERMIQYLRKS